MGEHCLSPIFARTNLMVPRDYRGLVLFCTNSYSPVLAFIVAGMLCSVSMTADIPNPYSVPGIRSIGRCRNKRYSVCVSRVGRKDEKAGSQSS